MNIKISKEQHERLSSHEYDEFLFGSQLHGIATEESDSDYIRLYWYEDVFDVGIESFLPNIHSFQYDDVENNKQYVWLTHQQFWRNLWSGDGNMLADVVIFDERFEDKLQLVRTQKVIKGYLGVAKRDLKLHGNNEKKRFHAFRSLEMAEMLMMYAIPTSGDIVALKAQKLPTKGELMSREKELRAKLIKDESIPMYPNFSQSDPLLRLMVNSNNIKEFNYGN